MKPLQFHSEAVDELDAAIDWYNRQQSGLGLALHEEIQHLLERITSDPQTGLSAGVDELRFLPANRFPYIVYWLELESVTWVVAIAHGRRQPEYWRGRLSSS